MGLVEVLQDDGDVHVDDDHEVDDDERHKEDDGDKGEAAVAVWQFLVFWITVGRLERESVFKSYQTGLGFCLKWQFMPTTVLQTSDFKIWLFLPHCLLFNYSEILWLWCI